MTLRANIGTPDTSQSHFVANLVGRRTPPQLFERTKVWRVFPNPNFIDVAFGTRFGRYHLGGIALHALAIANRPQQRDQTDHAHVHPGFEFLGISLHDSFGGVPLVVLANSPAHLSLEFNRSIGTGNANQTFAGGTFWLDFVGIGNLP